jgi:hypothetical protein
MGETLPVADKNTTTVKLSNISELVEINVEPVGRGYEKYLKVIHGLESIELVTPDASVDNLKASVGGEPSEQDVKNYEAHKKSNNPLDHLVEKDYYDVLGLGDLRYNATQDDIKKACMYSNPLIALLIHSRRQKSLFNISPRQSGPIIWWRS